MAVQEGLIGSDIAERAVRGVEEDAGAQGVAQSYAELLCYGLIQSQDRH